MGAVYRICIQYNIIAGYIIVHGFSYWEIEIETEKSVWKYAQFVVASC